MSVALEQVGELAARVVAAVVGVDGQHEHEPELVARRVRELVFEDLRDLARPEELVLKVDELPSRVERARVRLEDPKLAARNGGVDPLRNRPHELQNGVARRRLCARRRQRLAGDLVPAQTEVLGDVRDDRTAKEQRGVVPADGAARDVLVRVPAVAGVVGEIDAADERDAIVDDHELLVVAVHRPLLRVRREADARAELERVPDALDVIAVGVEERQR